MVSVIKERVDGGDYSVDPLDVAAAMLERLRSPAKLADLCSEMLVATQLTGASGELETLAGDDPA